MTDEQIIKALECCSSSNSEQCKKCPLISQKDELFSCLYQKESLSLDLINRQKAEIERLKKKNEKYLNRIEKDIVLPKIFGEQAKIEAIWKCD